MQNTNVHPLPPSAPNGQVSPRSFTPGLPRHAWRMFIALLEMPLRYLFGRDLFISYSRSDSRSDARKYAPALAITLQKRMPKLSFYLDRWIAPASRQASALVTTAREWG